MNTKEIKDRSTYMEPDRLKTLTDGVFAIVMTLLVLEIHIPEIPRDASAIELARELVNLIPMVLSFVVSVVILGIYWLSHDIQHQYIVRSDRTLAWLNILFILAIAFVPFSSALAGNYGLNETAIIVWAANQIIAGVILLLHWRYASGESDLTDNIDKRFRRTVSWKISLTPIMYSAAIIVSFIMTELAIIILIAAPIVYLLLYLVPDYVHKKPLRKTV